MKAYTPQEMMFAQGQDSQEPAQVSMAPWNAQVGKLLQRVADQLSDLVLGVTAEGFLYYVSPAIEDVMGYSPENFRRLYNRALSQEDGRFNMLQELLQTQLEDLKQAGDSHEPDSVVLNHHDGFRITLQVRFTPMRDEAGKLQGAVCVCRDLTARRYNFETTALASKVFEGHLTATYITNNHGKVMQVNQAFERLTGYNLTQVSGNGLDFLGMDFVRPAFVDSVTDSLRQRGAWEGEVQLRRQHGEVFQAYLNVVQLRDAQGRVMSNIGFFLDITEHKNSEPRIHRLAFLDSLTHLPNRSLCLDRLDQALLRAQRSQKQVLVVSVNLDAFHSINATLGWEAGDDVLCQMAQRIGSCLRQEDTVARNSGDSFVVIIEGLADGTGEPVDKAAVVEKIRQVLQAPFTVDGMEISLGGSVGAACYPDDGDDARILIQQSAMAMQRAKENGGGAHFFTAAMTGRVQQQVQLREDISAALNTHQFQLQYQPIIDVESGEAIRQEALLRWSHPHMGLLLPQDFLSQAERLQQVEALGCWVLGQAVAHLQNWQNRMASTPETKPTPKISVNVSPQQLRSNELLQQLQGYVGRGHLKPEQLSIEVKASALERCVQDAAKSPEVQHLLELQEIGIDLALDDFGAGGWPLELLSLVPVQTIKLSPRFVTQLHLPRQQQLLRGLVAMAQVLSAKVIAVGIETPAQLEAAQKAGCVAVQGYLLAEPVTAANVDFGSDF